MALKKLEACYATKRAKDYKLADGEGLYLLLRASGSKLWRFKCRFGGKEKLFAFGVYPAVSLAAARLRRAEAKVALGQGRNTGAKDAPAAVTTFEQAARAWHTHRLASLDKGYAERLMARLERDAFPALGCVVGTGVHWRARMAGMHHFRRVWAAVAAPTMLFARLRRNKNLRHRSATPVPSQLTRTVSRS
jgi:hypothetical protein